MAVSRFALTGNIADLTGAALSNYRSVGVFVETNLPAGEAVIDTEGNKIMPGVLRLTPDASGGFSASLISTADDPAVQPNNRQYRVRIDLPSQRLGSRTSRETWDSGWFNLTADADLADRVVVDFVPATYVTQATQQLDAHAESLQAPMDAAVTDAQTYAADAEASAQTARDISNIATSEDVLDTLLPGKMTDAADPVGSALSASTAQQIDATVPPLVIDTMAQDPTIASTAAAAADTAVTAEIAGRDLLEATPLPSPSGYARTWEDENGRLAIGIRPDGHVDIPGLDLADGTIDPDSLTEALHDATGRDLAIPTSGYARTIEDADGRLAFGIREDGSVDIPALNMSDTFKQEVLDYVTPAFDPAIYVIDVVTDGGGNRQLVAHNLDTGAQTTLTSTGDNFGPVVTRDGRVVFARTGSTTLLTVPVAGGTIAPASSTADVAWWGDSLSAMGTPGELDALLPAAIDVYNGGVGSQTARQILGRQGGVPITVTLEGGQVPASGPVSVASIAPIDPCYNTSGRKYLINGVLGTLSARTGIAPDATGTITAGTQTFTRDAAGAAVPVSPDTVIVPDLGQQYASRTTVLWVGRNSVYTDAETDSVASATMAAVDYLTPAARRVLVLGVTNASDEPMGNVRYDRVLRINAAQEAQFGNADSGGLYVDIRRYLIDNGLAAGGFTPTADDTAAIAVDAMPPSLLEAGDNIHFNATTRGVIAAYVHSIMIEKGWY